MLSEEIRTASAILEITLADVTTAGDTESTLNEGGIVVSGDSLEVVLLSIDEGLYVGVNRTESVVEGNCTESIVLRRMLEVVAAIVEYVVVEFAEVAKSIKGVDIMLESTLEGPSSELPERDNVEDVVEVVNVSPVDVSNKLIGVFRVASVVLKVISMEIVSTSVDVVEIVEELLEVVLLATNVASGKEDEISRLVVRARSELEP